MEQIKRDIAKIVEEGNIEEMRKLSDMLEEVIDILERYDKEKYKKYKQCIYVMANGYVIDEEQAEEIVQNMKPYGKKWTIEETTSVKNDYGLSRIRDVDFFIVMNSKYNDNKSTIEKYASSDEMKLDMYVDLSKDFILDPDAKEGHIYKYFM